MDQRNYLYRKMYDNNFYRLILFQIILYEITKSFLYFQRKDLVDIIQNLSYESVLSIIGKVVARPDGQQNKKMKTGDVEIYITSLEVLNVASPNLPIFIREYNKAKESQQMRYRYLSLRYPELQRNLRMRSRLMMKMREFLINECNFVDIETPTLFKNTPGVCFLKEGYNAL